MRQAARRWGAGAAGRGSRTRWGSGLADAPVRLAIGERIAVRAAWLGFPDLTVEPLDQIYERVSESQYRYESGKGSYLLALNPVGFVTRYPGLWELEGTV